MNNEVSMCRPCAERLKAENKAIMKGSVKDKGICDECKRSRFLYRVERVVK